MSGISLRALFLFSAALVVAVNAQAQPRQNWGMVQGTADSEIGLTKLLYSERDESDADLYLRCKADEGWVFLIHNYVPKTGSPSFIIGAGDLRFLPSFRVEHVEVDDEFYVDAALPADHRALELLAEGIPVSVEGASYAAVSDIEKRTIKSFLKICDVQ